MPSEQQESPLQRAARPKSRPRGPRLEGTAGQSTRFRLRAWRPGLAGPYLPHSNSFHITGDTVPSPSLVSSRPSPFLSTR